MKTKTLINFSKVVYVLSWWENQDGDRRKDEPKQATVHGCFIAEHEFAAPHPSYPFETQKERAIRLGILDAWKFKVRFMMFSNHPVQYGGKLGEKIYNDYLKWKFGQDKRKTK